MKKSTIGLQLAKRHAKRLLGTLCVLAILLPVTPSVASGAIDALSDNNSSTLLEAVTKLREDVTSRMDTLSTKLRELFLDAVNALTTSAQQPNIATLSSTGAHGFVGESKSGNAASVYDLVENAIQTSVTAKLQAMLAPGDEAAQNSRNQILVHPTPSTDDISQMMNMQSLLGSLSYTSTQQNQAERTVAFFSNYSSPMGSIDLNKLHAKPDLESSAAGQAYKAKVYSQAALRSLLLGNLYQSFNSRVPVAGLGTMSGMPSSKPNASLAEVQKYIASRRISDPDWYTNLNTAPPIAVQREMVFVLGEIQWQLYQLHMDNERLLQTMTAIGISSVQANKMIPERSEIDLKSALDGNTSTATDANIAAGLEEG